MAISDFVGTWENCKVLTPGNHSASYYPNEDYSSVTIEQRGSDLVIAAIQEFGIPGPYLADVRFDYIESSNTAVSGFVSFGGGEEADESVQLVLSSIAGKMNCTYIWREGDKVVDSGIWI